MAFNEYRSFDEKQTFIKRFGNYANSAILA